LKGKLFVLVIGVRNKLPTVVFIKTAERLRLTQRLIQRSEVMKTFLNAFSSV